MASAPTASAPMASAGVSGAAAAAAPGTTTLSRDQLHDYLRRWGIPDTRVQQRAERLAAHGLTLQSLVAAAAQPNLGLLVALLTDEEGAQRTLVDELDACTIQTGVTKAAAGRSAHEDPPGRSAHEVPPGRPFKRVKLPSKCSDLAHMSKAEAFLPSSLRSDSKVAFYAGRPRGVPLNIAPPALLCAPEFGIVHDAAHFGPSYSMAVGESEINIARELCNKMSKCYPSEDKRQEEFVDWFNCHFQDCGRMVVPEKMSASKEGGTGANDGQVVVRVNSIDYLQTVLEVKNESGHSGDPLFQGCRYHQKFYMDGQRWSMEDLLRASGAPSFTFELQGCDLVIGAVYIVEGNVVAREPLTDKMALLDLGLRMRVYEERLARVLAAFRAAARLLTWRMKKLAGCEGLETLEEITDRALAALPQPARQDVVAAMRAAVLSAPRMAQRPQQAGDPDIEQSSLPWARLPYPLAPPSAYPQVESLPGMASRAVFKCSGRDQAGCTCVLVKFEQRPYPVEVHKRLQSLNLVPGFISTQRLPGGWWAVEQEFLDAPWRSYDSFLNQMPSPSRESRAAAASAVAAVVAKMHGVGIVHGDLRPLNVLLRETAPNVFEVKLVDLEWAGALDDVPVYPLNMAARSPRLPWHGTAGPGKVLKKEHDEHLLQQLFY